MAISRRHYERVAPFRGSVVCHGIGIVIFRGCRFYCVYGDVRVMGLLLDRNVVIEICFGMRKVVLE